MAQAMGKGVGDTIVVSGAGTSREMTIVGIASSSFPSLWMRWDTVAEFADITLNGQPMARNLLVRTDGERSYQQANRRQDRRNQRAPAGRTASRPPTRISRISSSRSRRWSACSRSSSSITAGLIALVGALGLLMAISMSVFERQKEIGVMRSIGAGSSTVATQFLTEGLLIGLRPGRDRAAHQLPA